MLFVAGGAIAGAHHPGAGFAARTHAHAAFGGAFEGAVVFGEDEMGFPGLRSETSTPRTKARPRGPRTWGTQIILTANMPVAKVFDWIINPYRIQDFAGIHAIVGIPESIELAKCAHQFGAEHFGQQGRARLAVAMFAAERAAEAQNQVCGAIDEFAEVAQA